MGHQPDPQLEVSRGQTRLLVGTDQTATVFLADRVRTPITEVNVFGVVGETTGPMSVPKGVESRETAHHQAVPSGCRKAKGRYT